MKQKEILLLINLQLILSVIEQYEDNIFIPETDFLITSLTDSKYKIELELAYISLKIFHYSLLALNFTSGYRANIKACSDDIKKFKRLLPKSDFQSQHKFIISLMESFFLSLTGEPIEAKKALLKIYKSSFKTTLKDDSLIRNLEFAITENGFLPVEDLTDKIKFLINRHLAQISGKFFKSIL